MVSPTTAGSSPLDSPVVSPKAEDAINWLLETSWPEIDTSGVVVVMSPSSIVIVYADDACWTNFDVPRELLAKLVATISILDPSVLEVDVARGPVPPIGDAPRSTGLSTLPNRRESGGNIAGLWVKRTLLSGIVLMEEGSVDVPSLFLF